MKPIAEVFDPVAKPSRPRDVVRAYVELTKPRIIELLLVTTVPSMVLAADGWPGTWLVVLTLVGGALSAGGANTLNNVLDRDIDAVMTRTARRPMPTHRVQPGAGVVFGLALGVAGFGTLLWGANLLAAALATGALAFYVAVYTLLLKRTTVQNIVIGGAAGAVPTLVGWAAVTGTLDVTAFLLFGIVFYWTPPHFWALALRYRDDYAAAGVPMLPVVVGRDTTLRHMAWYSLILVALTLLLWPLVPMGPVYAVAAIVLGLWFAWGALALRRRPEAAMQYFRQSVWYLAALFTAIAVDRLVA